ncbi:hypothetical protein SKTS_22320 [Sulfurimicrobium lacus]|uniref:GGDEF domain-containing protein n=1 Tax=Sulfurimicrobium lacus TaxID=2715678 RepID=A0A6F8VE92_9PROT|nr:diguanylate cyclase [Sulfurimicrobium lacus]BCB27346.1 hypothetical protein SKTS_22320 [Sulfurimicrobium lacus]
MIILSRILATEAGFDALLLPYRERADRIMVGMNVFLLIVCLLIAPYRNTYAAALLIGLPTLALAFGLMRSQPGALITRLYMGCAFMAYTGLIIHQTGGDIEAHFSAFGLIGILLYYRDWRTIAAATVFIYLHHLVLGYVQTLGVPVYVFDEPRFWTLFGLHVAYFLPFVGMMGYLAIWLRREGYESCQVIDLAEQIMQGNLMENPIPEGKLREMPLIAAVLSMKNRLLDLLRVMPVPAAVIRIDNQMIVSVNEAWQRMFGSRARYGLRFSDCEIWSEPHVWHDLMVRLQHASDKLLDKVEVALSDKDGLPILCELSLILHEDAQPVMAILTVEDITQRRRTEQIMQNLAYRDMLTELPNRVSLHDGLECAFKAWHEKAQPFGLIMLDLDGFKPVNDTYGHDAGDEVLQIVGKRLMQINRGNDMAARLGGDEFVVLLNGCVDVAAATAAAQRAIDAISQPLYLRGVAGEVKIGASAGVTHSSLDAPSIEGVFKQADEALYISKSNGKNRVSVFGAGQNVDMDAHS